MLLYLIFVVSEVGLGVVSFQGLHHWLLYVIPTLRSLSVGLKTGYKLFPLTSLERLEPSFEKGTPVVNFVACVCSSWHC